MEIKRIVVGVDFSEEGDLAAREALTIARHMGAEITLVHVGAALHDFGTVAPSTTTEWMRLLSERAAEDQCRMDALVEALSGHGPEISQLTVNEGPAEGICEAAKQVDADLVVVGTHGRTGAKRFFLGSVAERVVRLCERNVMIARDGNKAASGYDSILVPTDFSPHAEAALRQSLALASPGAKIDVVHFWLLPVVPSGGFGESAMMSLPADQRSAIEAMGAELVAKYKHARCEVSFSAVEAGAAHGIVDRVNDTDRHYDALIMGSHGRRGFRRFLLGSVAERCVRHAPCSVMVVHEKR